MNAKQPIRGTVISQHFTFNQRDTFTKLPTSTIQIVTKNDHRKLFVLPLFTQRYRNLSKNFRT